VVAVNVGVIVAALLFMPHGRRGHVEQQMDTTPGPVAGARLPARERRCQLQHRWPLSSAPPRNSSARLRISTPGDTLILRMGTSLHDATVSTNRGDNPDFKRHGATVLLVELRPNVRYKLGRSGVIAEVGEKT